MSSSTRSSQTAALFGPEFAQKIKNTRILVVGSGGIGCELLKNIVLAGFGDITLLDLDTIDLSNLNRQFLFRKKDVKQPKALVAARTAAAFNPAVKIEPLYANIKEAQFDAQWFAGFNIVMSALDNLDARKHINRMCLAAGVPLVESGTEGYFGQVQPIIQYKSECYECTPKPTKQRTYPVCTIRSTPSQPIHSIVWAKSYLLPQLFGEEENESELDKAEQDGENPAEIEALRKEAQEWKNMRAALRSPNAKAGRSVFEKAFRFDTEKLLSMDDMWQNRQRPVPLDYDAVLAGTFVLRGEAQTRHTSLVNGTSSNGTNGHTAPQLRDQRSLTLPESLDLLISSVDRLAARLQKGEDIIAFDKDDDDTLDFVTAASNLRSAVYNIPQKNRWDVKEMAGNIIPAIATTNAIISGLIVLQALQILRGTYDELVWPYLTAKPNKPITGSQLPLPNSSCGACQDTYMVVQCNPDETTLGQLVQQVLEHVILGEEENEEALDPSQVNVFEAGRVLADPDFDDNLEKSLSDLGCGRGKFISIVDEDEQWNALSIALCLLPDGHKESTLILPASRPTLRPKSKASAPSPQDDMDIDRSALKRKYDAEDDEAAMDEDGPAKKKQRSSKRTPYPSPSKAQRLEEDGLVILEDDVTIIID